MARVFHLNMRRYGGGNVGRSAAFGQAFTGIQTAGGADFIVAGFTEVMSRDQNLRVQLSGLAQALDPELTQLVVIEVGTTALGTCEYIGITWDPNWVVMQHAGQVLWDPTMRRWAAHNRPAAALVNPAIRLPAAANLAADTRGLAYIAATYERRHILFGFMHNMYRLGSRYVAYTSLPAMAQQARTTIGGAFADAEVIIGGDFNLRPRQPRPPRGNALALHERAAIDRRGYVNTTWWNPFDYWVVSDPDIGRDDARVHRSTRMPRLSDHAAIALYYG